MEKELQKALALSGLLTETVTKLEDVTTMEIFKSLRAEHFTKLLPKLSVGQHALLLTTWEGYCEDVIEPLPKKVTKNLSHSEI